MVTIRNAVSGTVVSRYVGRLASNLRSALKSRAVGTLALERGFVLRVLLGRDGGEGSDLVDNWGILNLLVDGLGLVDNGGFDSLALNNGLDCLVDVVVLVLIKSSTDMLSALLDGTSGSGVVSQVLLLGKSLLVFRSHLLLVFSSDHRLGGVDMLGVEGLVVLNGLDSVLKVVDMSLTVDRFSGLNMFLRPDMLLDDFGRSVRADFSGLGLARLREEFLDTLGNAGHYCL